MLSQAVRVTIPKNHYLALQKQARHLPIKKTPQELIRYLLTRLHQSTHMDVVLLPNNLKGYFQTGWDGMGQEPVHEVGEYQEFGKELFGLPFYRAWQLYILTPTKHKKAIGVVLEENQIEWLEKMRAKWLLIPYDLTLPQLANLFVCWIGSAPLLVEYLIELAQEENQHGTEQPT